jgi:hypothetical protein
MKFYKERVIDLFIRLNIIENNKLTAIYSSEFDVTFFKNGKYHNAKNAAYIHDSSYKQFCLNGKYYGDNNTSNQNYFTKQSWRKFIKLQAFL